MTEFAFRSLSVKLLPEAAADDAGQVCVCCSYEYACQACSECTDTATGAPCGECTDGATDPGCGPCSSGETDRPDPGCGATGGECFPCTDFETDCGIDTCQQGSDLVHTHPVLVHEDPPEDAGRVARRPEQIRSELALLKAELRAAMGLPPEEPATARRAPGTAQEAERVRAALLDAVAELDEQRDAYRQRE